MVGEESERNKITYEKKKTKNDKINGIPSEDSDYPGNLKSPIYSFCAHKGLRLSHNLSQCTKTKIHIRLGRCNTH